MQSDTFPYADEASKRIWETSERATEEEYEPKSRSVQAPTGIHVVRLKRNSSVKGNTSVKLSKANQKTSMKGTKTL